MINSREYCITGEVDQEDELCGYGTGFIKISAIQFGIDRLNTEGTFFNNKPHGICEYNFLNKMPDS